MNIKLNEKNEGANEGKINELLENYGDAIPSVYIEFLKYTNGYYFDETSTLLYASNEISERNATYEVDKYLKDYVAIGDRDGDKIIVMKKDSASNVVYIADSFSIAMEDFSFECEYPEFSKFIDACKRKEKKKNQPDLDVLYDVVVINPIQDKKMILEAKKIFNYKESMTTLLTNCQNPPFVIMKNITYGLADKLIHQNQEIAKCVTIKKTK